ncbi:hypothetical protein COO60DRAFT_1775 [Scenedesmus sp. NREL 46B-D3]|nr:hypothetical protein COO60DRAFT_1775 [Scenedesmus sp. NREL 46B-D3]
MYEHKIITAGLDTCAKNAVKLRLQLAEYCILKCTSKAQLPALLPLLTKQVNRQCNGRLTCLRLLMLVAAWICKCHNSSRRCVPPAKALNLLCYTGAGNKVLEKNRNDAACISALAALMASCLAKLLHELPQGSYALTHGRSCGYSDSADTLCEVLLFPVIRSTYRDPEQARVAAGSQVLLALLEVLKAYAQQLEHAAEAMRMCLELMVQLLGMGTLAQRVPGVLLPLCTCLDVLGAMQARRASNVCCCCASKELLQRTCGRCDVTPCRP